MIGGDANACPFHHYCWQEWVDKHGMQPPWLKIDYAHLARAYKAFGDDPQARAAWRLFLASTDPFYAGHEPRKFVSSLGKWAKPIKPAGDSVGALAAAEVARRREEFKAKKLGGYKWD